MQTPSTPPLVSVITPLYNAESFINETIQSVLNQTYTNWEMLIVDDCSTDNGPDIVKEYQEKEDRVYYVRLKDNSGAAIARNVAIQLAKGKYIAFLDSDDLWLPAKLEKQVAFMEDGQKAFSFTGYGIMKENGEIKGKVVEAPEVVNYEYLLKNTIIGCLTVMLNVELLGKVQMEPIRTRQDFLLWLSILKQGVTAHGLNETLAMYRRVNDSISSQKLQVAKRNWEIYRKFEKLPFLKSCYVFMNYAWNGLKKV
ncbi:glycosyltransferase family 2 protein [Alkalihalophilus sp. As8PL]|uniref:Glycosyltransferase family 2 protein n=1 Tax=Alkalihalophilus sp. As8PL TaxID=3237103 RepID=A0AB39BQK6_9BACI